MSSFKKYTPFTQEMASTILSFSLLLLSVTGYECKALHLELAFKTLESHHSQTIVAPFNTTFEHHHHHHHSLHLLPHSLSLHSLTSLPFGTSIPTLLPSPSPPPLPIPSPSTTLPSTAGASTRKRCARTHTCHLSCSFPCETWEHAAN
ncbi:hypothetical protein AAZV13_13G085900 [Glycine max]